MVVGEAQWRDLKPLSAQMFVERFWACDASQRQDGARRGTLLTLRKQRAALAIAKRGEEEFLRRRKAEALPDVGALRFIGPFGAFRDDVNLRDVVIGMGASTDSKVNRIRFKDHDFAALADFDLVRHAVDAAKMLGIAVKVGNLFSADLFYNPDVAMFDVMEKYGILGVEMEAAGIYGVAAEFGAKALTICTVSDHIKRHEQTSAEERQLTFNEMIEIALESILLGDQA